MKFALFAVLTSLAAAVSAQSITIGSPAVGTSITPGTNITVQVNRPNSLTGSQEVAIVISLAACAGPCPDPADRLGSTLYAGSFNPQYPANPRPWDQPQQNFTVAVPAYLPAGPAQLSVVHLSLVAAGPFPLFEIKNTTLNVV
ncbi:hypothetical protein BV25DRAFT_1838998 [Artomyces pyxidatus]|uniref:Uncharacterized protein n=1 Tax=Artomyces pyxidatus TaxID=48021 RepID=A0ACB8SZI8_9AGAM|nr:hypothetical protein BV25DRAFT_1838998 [Artomyces pyxidatus]